MQKVKSAARKAAWYPNDNDDVKTYNIFGRTRTNPLRRNDIESGPHKTPTDNDISSPIEDARRADNQKDQDDFSGPHKAGTFPAGPNGNLPPSRDEIGSSSSGSKPSTEKTAIAEKEAERDLSGSGEAPEDGGTTMRRRKGMKFWKKSDGEKQASTRDRKRDKFGPPPPVMSQFKAVLYSWINLLLIFVPVGFALEYAHVNKIVVFVINFLAIIPLAAMLSFATEELALYIARHWVDY